MAAKKKPTGDRTYVMSILGGHWRRITVPASWRVTFGPLVPPRERTHHDHKTFALRFYEGTDQRAIFTDVLSFFDESLTVRERVSRVHKVTKDENSKHASRVTTTEWLDPIVPPGIDADGDGKFVHIEDKNVDWAKL